MAIYTLSERKKILHSRKSDESIRDLGIRCGVSTTSLYQWLKDIETGNSVSFAQLLVTNPPVDATETISIIYENFTIQLPVQTDVGSCNSYTWSNNFLHHPDDKSINISKITLSVLTAA